MVNFGELFRLLAIQRILIRNGLDEIIFATHLFRPVRFLFFLLPWNWFGRRAYAPRAQRLRIALEELGPVFVKLGQLLSTRRDMLPEDIADEFAKLQDNVPPFPGAEARRIIESELGRPINVVSELHKTLMHELDLMREAANASQLRRNFEQSDTLYVPAVEWPLTTEKVMV